MHLQLFRLEIATIVWEQTVNSVERSSSQLSHVPSLLPEPPQPSAKPKEAPAGPSRLTATDAVDIWIARWLRMRRKDILVRYKCDPRRIYEIWEETRFPGSRARALEIFRERYPTLLDRIDQGPHKRIASRTAHPDQLGLFD